MPASLKSCRSPLPFWGSADPPPLPGGERVGVRGLHRSGRISFTRAPSDGPVTPHPSPLPMGEGTRLTRTVVAGFRGHRAPASRRRSNPCSRRPVGPESSTIAGHPPSNSDSSSSSRIAWRRRSTDLRRRRWAMPSSSTSPSPAGMNTIASSASIALATSSRCSSKSNASPERAASACRWATKSSRAAVEDHVRLPRPLVYPPDAVRELLEIVLLGRRIGEGDAKISQRVIGLRLGAVHGMSAHERLDQRRLADVMGSRDRDPHV